MKPCPLCQKRGKTWEGDDPRCAFINGVFDSDNWNCATMNILRELLCSNIVFSEEEKCGVIPFNGWFIILFWYKNRGRTNQALIKDEGGVRTLTLEDATDCISLLKKEGFV